MLRRLPASQQKYLKQTAHIVRSKLFITVMAVASVTFGVIGFSRADAAVVQDCSANSIIACGSQTPGAFINKLNANNPADLQAIYSYFGLDSSMYGDFSTNAKMGTAYKDGRIVVDGQTVATNAWSIGREKKSYSSDMIIGSHTYYKSMNKDVFVPDSIPAMVYFDAKTGQISFAVLTACGNPMGGTPVKPSMSCDLLQKTAVQGQPNSYNFTTKASAANGATVDHVTYDFGDGSTPVTASSLTQTVPHSYQQTGTYTAKVTVYVKTAGGLIPVVSNTCQTTITVQEQTPPPVTPPAPVAVNLQCTGLTAVRSNDDLTYVFRATASASNATLGATDFNFGDGSVANGVMAENNSALSASVTHSYSQAGSYTATATLHYKAQNGDTSTDRTTTCQVAVSPTQTPPATPAATPPAAPAPAAPAPTLPNTGAADIAGFTSIFSGASAIGALGYRTHVKRRVAKIDRLFGSGSQR